MVKNRFTENKWKHCKQSCNEIREGYLSPSICYFSHWCLGHGLIVSYLHMKSFINVDLKEEQVTLTKTDVYITL